MGRFRFSEIKPLGFSNGRLLRVDKGKYTGASACHPFGQLHKRRHGLLNRSLTSGGMRHCRWDPRASFPGTIRGLCGRFSERRGSSPALPPSSLRVVKEC